jgi:hypothetical protein
MNLQALRGVIPAVVTPSTITATSTWPRLRPPGRCRSSPALPPAAREALMLREDAAAAGADALISARTS